jgi:hypothetical protein
MNKKNLHSFLHLGYFLDYTNPTFDIDLSNLNTIKNELEFLSEPELLEQANKVWFSTFERLYEEGVNVVPISGGLDSRAILATLLHFTDAQNIKTYTFGTPGTYDYDIGKYLANKIGTKHKMFPFNKYEFTTDKEIEVSKRINHQTFLFHHPPLEILDDIYGNDIVWSGCILDWLAGTSLFEKPANSLEGAKQNVFFKEKFVKSVDLCIDSDSFEDLLSSDSILDSSILSFEEQLQAKNHVVKDATPHIIYNNLQYKVPAFNSNLYLFFLGLNNKHRLNESFYKKFLYSQFPDVFKMPTKASSGLSLGSSNLRVAFRKTRDKSLYYLNKIHPSFTYPHTNYMDFNEGIRRRKDLNQVVYDNIIDLKNREIVDWIDVEKIFNNHMNRKGNHADALIVLSSLEIHLKAGKII